MYVELEWVVVQGLSALDFKLAGNIEGFACPWEQDTCEHETILENKVFFVNLDTHDQLLG